MKKIKNEKLIKSLIKKDYKIPLHWLEEIDFVMTQTNCKTVEDWDKILEYLSWYTENTREKHHQKNWTNKESFETYYNYLKNFEDLEVPLFPKERDIWYLNDTYHRLKRSIEREFKELLTNKIHEEYDKACKYLNW